MRTSGYDEIRAHDRKSPVTIGAASFLGRTNRFLPEELTSCNDVLSVHAYPIFVDWAEDMDPGFAPFLTLFMKRLTGGERPVLLQEFGLPTAGEGKPGERRRDRNPGVDRELYHAGEEEAARYYQEVLEKCYEVGASGAYCWCYSDYSDKVSSTRPFDELEFERYFGVLRADGSPKPQAKAIKAFKEKVERGEITRRYDHLPDWDMSEFTGGDYTIDDVIALYGRYKEEIEPLLGYPA